MIEYSLQQPNKAVFILASARTIAHDGEQPNQATFSAERAESLSSRCSGGLRRIHDREATEEFAVGQGAVAVLVERVHDGVDLVVC